MESRQEAKYLNSDAAPKLLLMLSGFYFLRPVIFALCFFCTLSAKAGHPLSAQTTAASGTGFTQNLGQLATDRNQPLPDFYYKSSISGTDIYIGKTGLTYVFFKPEKEDEREDESMKERKIKWCRLEMKLVGASISKTKIEESEPIEQGYFNYYFPNCPKGILNVKTFRKITAKDVYPGIDWVIYINEKGLKYDFIVRPGADPSQIKIVYEGQDNIKTLNQNQLLQIKTRYSRVEEGTVVSFEKETGRNINVTYSLNKNQVAFNFPDYDKSKTLVIDPPIQLLNWATYYGGADRDGPRGICTDVSGNTYIAGYAGSNPFPTQALAGAFNGSFNGSSAFMAFILKFDNNGVRKWATYFGGSSRDAAQAIKNDATGNIFLTGYTQSGDFPMMDPGGGAFTQTVNTGGNSELFISKFNATGALVWSTFYGGSAEENGRALDVDGSGNAYITGYTNSNDFPVMNGGAFFQGTYAGGVSSLAGDAFILKFNNAGVRQWATFYGGTGDDAAYSIKVASAGNVYISGVTESSNFPVQNAGGTSYFQGSNGGNKDAFILKLNNNGNRTWCTYYGGSSDEGDFHMAPAYDRTDGRITTDNLENIYLTGYSGSSDFPTLNPGGNTFFQAAGAGNSPFLVKFRPSGQRIWSTFYGDNGTGGALLTDAQNNLYLAGNTLSASFPTVSPGCNAFVQSNFGGGLAHGDIFIALFDSAGVRSWSTYFGGPADDWVDGLSLSPSGCVYLTGEWLSASGINTLNPGGGAFFQPNLGGPQGSCDNGFVLKFCTAPITATTSQTALLCPNDSNAVATVSVCGGNTPYTYTWTTTPPKFTPAVTNLPAGNYVITIRDASGNTFTSSVNITAPTAVSVSAASSATIVSGTSIAINATGNVSSFTWSPAAGLSATNISNPSASPTITTVYTVVATTSNNCRASDVLTITVIEPAIVCGDVFVPTGFTPNNDGANDFECVMGNCIVELNFSIYDRWGEKVFETTDVSKCWDGVKNGKIMDSGVFVYHLVATLQNGEKVNKKGNIHLFR